MVLRERKMATAATHGSPRVGQFTALGMTRSAPFVLLGRFHAGCVFSGETGIENLDRFSGGIGRQASASLFSRLAERLMS